MHPMEQLLNEQDHKTKTAWALDCAEHVISYFNDLFPEDSRPNDAIAAGRSWIGDASTVLDAQKASVAAHNAARDVVETEFSQTDYQKPLSEGEGMQGAACAAARAAGQAVAAAHAAGHAQHAATYALKAVSFAEGADAVSKEREWQYQKLAELAQK
ncbi:hypothetical protein MmiAt1_13110 [Methanimicrococcus sp. At1]|uniref:Imm-5-like domain-containing protein n=1 Tax=Methanimicrococcus hacksteinii TaxID=3028293 RepID=A0ABU3VQM8_9EURY|nr:hypothetical protein [Methanimicrococcus sp. At1]MDV0445717.1 hypothetical protein [Methanimicrococcus sp. At1]